MTVYYVNYEFNVNVSLNAKGKKIDRQMLVVYIMLVEKFEPMTFLLF